MITRPGAELLPPQRPLGTPAGDQSVWEVGAMAITGCVVHGDLGFAIDLLGQIPYPGWDWLLFLKPAPMSVMGRGKEKGAQQGAH